MPAAGTKAAETSAGTFRFFCLLWLAGLAMRMTLLVVPPVIPLIHEDLRMSETQIGLLIGLPLALFAIAAVPGSLLVARGGAKLAVMLGMAVTAIAGGLRGAAVDVWTLYAAVIATGFGIAIMQPGMPTLLREWLPNRVGLGTVVYSNGMVIGATLPPVLTIPLILPLIGGIWRLNFVVWAVPAIVISIVFFLLSPRKRAVPSRPRRRPAGCGGRTGAVP
jgi:MFS transporter, CP family, cyanate transporter